MGFEENESCSRPGAVPTPNILDSSLPHPCDTPVLKKIFAHPKPVTSLPTPRGSTGKKDSDFSLQTEEQRRESLTSAV